MRLRSIWRAGYPMPLRERLNRTAEWGWMTAARRLPKRLQYWMVIQAGANFSEQHPRAVVPEIYLMDVIKDHPGGRP